MFEYLEVLFAAAFVNNFVLVQFLGLCPFVGTSKRLLTAIPLALATCLVIVLSIILTHALFNLLLQPWDLGYLKLVVFILSIATAVQLTERYVRYSSPVLHQMLGIYLPLITSNCAILGVVLLVADLDFLVAIFTGIGAAIGFTIVLVLFASLRERLESSSIPESFRGTPIAFLTAGILALSFYGFRGMV